MTSPLNTADLELAHYSGAVIPLALVTVRDGRGRTVPRSIKSALSAAVADEPLAAWLEPYVQETWVGGCGGGGATMGYAQAPGLVTYLGDSKAGSVFPGPAEFAAGIPQANQSATPFVAIEQYNNDLYFVQQGAGAANSARVLSSIGGIASLGDTLGGASGYPTAAGNTLTGAVVFRDRATNVRKLWVSGNDAAGGRLHYYDGATTVWTSTPSGTFGAVRFDWISKVFWRTANGDQAWRLVTGDVSTGRISYTRPAADPKDAASWVLDAFEVDTAGQIRRPPAVKRHLYLPATDNLYDVDELGDTSAIIADLEQHPLNGYASLYGGDDYVYLTRGQGGGIGRVYVGDPGTSQPTIGQCGPGAFTGAEHQYGGFASCFANDQGTILAAMYNANNGYAGIWRGRDRRHYPEVETANPLIWWGPEIHSTAGMIVTAMRTHTNLTANQIHLWVAFGPYAAGGPGFIGGNPKISYFTLPVAGQPLSDFLTGGTNLFATGTAAGGDWQQSCRITSLPYSWADKAAPKYLHETTIGTRGLDAAAHGTSMDFYTRADPGPTDTSFPPGVGIGASPVVAVEPGTTTRGYKTQYLVQFVSPHGADALATRHVGVLDSVRMTAFRRAPTVRVLDLTVQYGHGIRDLDGGYDPSKSPDDVRGLLADLTRGDRTTMRVRPDRRYQVLLRQVLDESTELVGGEERSTVRLQLGILKEL